MEFLPQIIWPLASSNPIAHSSALARRDRRFPTFPLLCYTSTLISLLNMPNHSSKSHTFSHARSGHALGTYHLAFRYESPKKQTKTNTFQWLSLSFYCSKEGKNREVAKHLKSLSGLGDRGQWCKMLGFLRGALFTHFTLCWSRLQDSNSGGAQKAASTQGRLI